MPTFDAVPTVLASTWQRSLRHAHHAVQLVAAAGATLLPSDPSHVHTSLTFDAGAAALVGQPLPHGRRVRLVLPTLTLEVKAPHWTARLGLLGRTMAQARAWLERALSTRLTFPDWELPGGPSHAFGRLDPAADDMIALAAWLDASHDTLRRFTPSLGVPSPVRVWPHHFDIAVLVTLDPAAGRTTGLGMTPSDAEFRAPCLYVTPWPYPAARPTPELPGGVWHVEGWYGAVQPAHAVRSQAQVDAFLAAAFEACARATEEAP